MVLSNSEAAAFLPTTTNFFLATILILVLQRFHRHHHHQQQQSPGNENNNSKEIKIETCANPNCARCRRYKELNRTAQRRLPWLLKSHRQQREEQKKVVCNEKDPMMVTEPLLSPFARIIDAVQNGPAYNTDGTTRSTISDRKATEDKDTSVSPIKGQQPTVLLIRGLSVSSSFNATTSLHSEVCSILEGVHGKERVRDVILKEYFTAAAKSNENGSQPSSWLNNDVVAINNSNNNKNKTTQNLQIPSSSWKVLHFQNQGKWISPTMSKCPKTTTIIQSLPNVMANCIFGNIFLSVLTPNTKITPHCGPCNVRHRLHFPLLVPSSSSSSKDEKKENPQQPELHVVNEFTTWKEGKSFVFDDSLVHFAIYPPTKRQEEQTTPRVVLIVDLWHPDLSQEERDLISELYPAATATTTT